MNSKKQSKWTGVLLFIVGIIFAVVGIFVLKQGDNLKARCTEETTGTIVDIVSERDHSSDSSDRVYYPVVEYKVGDRIVNQKSRSGQTPCPYYVGQQVTVYYNPNNVEEYFIEGDSTPMFIGIVFIVIGSVVAVAVVIFVFFGKAGKQKKTDDSSSLYRDEISRTQDENDINYKN